ncbi:MAG: hypothetical protein AB7V04_00495 [Desulfomonilaceae bacterium]
MINAVAKSLADFAVSQGERVSEAPGFVGNSRKPRSLPIQPGTGSSRKPGSLAKVRGC